MPNSSATFLLMTDFSLAKDFQQVYPQVFDLSRSSQPFYQLLPQDRVGRQRLKQDHPLLPWLSHLGRLVFNCFVASTTVEKADAMVLSIGTQMASTLPVMTETVEATSFVEGTE